MEASWNWSADDWWNKQLEEKVDQAATARERAEETNRDSGISRRRHSRREQLDLQATSEMTPSPPRRNNGAGLRAGEDVMGRAPSLRWQTTSHRDQARMLAHRGKMPTRRQVVEDLRRRKQQNTTTTIDFSGFGEPPTPKDWATDMQIGQRDLSPEKIAAVRPTAEEREEQRQRKLNFKFSNQIVLGEDPSDFRTASTLPVPTSEELMRGTEIRNSNLAKMVKTSHIDFVFNHPDKPTAEDYKSILRNSSAPMRKPAEIAAEKERAKQMKKELTKSQFSIKDSGGAAFPSSRWRTTMTDASVYDSNQASQARGAEALELKKHLQRHHFDMGEDKAPYKTQMQSANEIMFGNPRDPNADKQRAIDLKKALVTSTISLGWQDDYY